MLRFVYHAGHMHPQRPLVSPSADESWYLVLCGDLGVARFEVNKPKGFVQFGDMLVSIVQAGWTKVFYVPGPREFAGSAYHVVLEELRDLASALDDRLVILSDESVAHVDEETGVTLWVTGSTLWTDQLAMPKGHGLGIFHHPVDRSSDSDAASNGSSSGEMPEAGGVFLIEDVDPAMADPKKLSHAKMKRVVRADEKWWSERHRIACEALIDGLMKQPPGSLGIVATYHLPSTQLAHCKRRSEVNASGDVPLKPHLGRTRVWFHACAPRDGIKQHVHIDHGRRFATLPATERKRLLTFCGADQYEHDKTRKLNTYKLRVRRNSLDAHSACDSTYTADAFELVRT